MSVLQNLMNQNNKHALSSMTSIGINNNNLTSLEASHRDQ